MNTIDKKKIVEEFEFQSGFKFMWSWLFTQGHIETFFVSYTP